MKKKFLLTTLLAVILCLTACSAKSVKDEIKQEIEDFKHDYMEEAFQMSHDAYAAIKDKDTDKLKSLFCENSKDDSAVEKLIASIEGDYKDSAEILDYKLWNHLFFGTSHYAIYRSEIESYTTTKSEGYKIRIVSCSNSEYDDKDVGVQYISLYDHDELVAEAGRIIERGDKKEITDELIDVDMDQFSPDYAKEEYSQNMLYYLNTQDKDGFVSLFRSDMKDEAEEQFDAIIKLMDGEFDGYYRFNAPGYGGEWEYDHWNHLEDEVYIYDLYNTDGDIFELIVATDYVDTKNRSKEGTYFFDLRKVDKQVNDTFEHDVIDSVTFGDEEE